MDLSSLPNEMLSNVLKYANFGRLMKLRKINQRIDNLAKRKKLGRLPVHGFEFMRNNRKEAVNGTNLVRIIFEKKYFRKHFAFVVQPNVNLSTALQFYLSRITVKNQFALSDINVDSTAMNELYKYKGNLNLVTQIMLTEVSFDIGKDAASKFYEKIFPNVDTMIVDGSGCRDIINSEVLSGRKFKRLELKSFDRSFYVAPHYELDDNFLANVVVNCEEVTLFSTSSRFTVFGVQKLFKACIAADGTFKRRFQLGVVFRLLVPLESLQEMFDRAIQESSGKDNSKSTPRFKLDVDPEDTIYPYCMLTCDDRDIAPYIAFHYTRAPLP